MFGFGRIGSPLIVSNKDKLCACGCGEKIKRLTNTYINGHNFRNKKHTQAHNEKIAKRLKGVSKGKGKLKSEDHKRKISESNIKTKGLCISKSILEDLYINQKLSTTEIGKKLGCTAKTIWNYLVRYNIPIRTISESILGRKDSEETKQKKSENHASKYQDVWNKGLTKETDERVAKISSLLKGKEYSEIAREKNSESSKKLWQDLDYIEKQHQARDIKPNKPESFLISLLAELYPNQWQYTGDFSYWINGKNPDFVNFNTKQVIEHFGDYWHKGRDPEQRKEIFACEGWDTLVIWEHELKNLDEVIYKIKKFVEI